MKNPIAVILTLVAMFATLETTASAQSFEATAKATDERLSRSLKELGQVRATIAKEKLPLSKSVFALEQEVLTLRRERDELRKQRDSRSIDLTSLQKQVTSLEKQDEFINSRLSEFVRDFEGRLDISELPRYEELTAAAKLAEKNVNLDADGRRAAQTAVVASGLKRLREQLAGHTYPGEALSPDGVLTQGQFVAIGPTVFYASDDGAVVGLVENQLNAADPVVVALPGDLGEDIAAIAAGGSGRLAFDATLGKALKKEKARKTLGQYVAEGGVVGIVIIALGACALGLAIFKAREISSFEVAGAEAVDGVLGDLAAGSPQGALKRAGEIRGIAGEMLRVGVEHWTEKRDLIEELMFEKILTARPKLERFQPFLALTAAASPLLGLLGTVIGMIKTFQLITIFGTGDAKSLSSGISEALITTALGLIVAIPALVAHGLLSRMTKHKLGRLEQLSVAFVNGIGAIRRDSGSSDERQTSA